jgi:hypothetical protein
MKTNNLNSFHYHGIVLADGSPENIDRFENKFSNLIQNQFDGAPVYLKFCYYFGFEIKNISRCIGYVEKEFKDIGKVRFNIKAYKLNGINCVILTWKNVKRFQNLLIA